MFGKSLFYNGLLLLASHVVISAAWGQTVDGFDRATGRVLEEQQERQRERSAQFERSLEAPPAGEDPQPLPLTPDREGGCADIRQVRVSGMNRYAPTDFGEVLASLKGSCIGIAAINDALRQITNRYLEDGYVSSRAFVGPQSLQSGELTIVVIEGAVEAVEGVGEHPYGKGELGAAFPLRAGRLLSLRGIEQGVEQLARMSKASPSIDIAPGTAPGTSRILVKRAPAERWVRPAILFNNEGSKSTGRLQSTATIDADSLLGLAEVWSFYRQINLHETSERSSSAFGGFVAFPYGWWSLSMSAGKSSYRSLVTGNAIAFETRGRSFNGSVSLDRMVLRDARTKLSLSAGLSALDTQNFVRSIKLRTGSYRIVTARMGVRLQRRVARSQLSMSGNFDLGVRAFGANTPDMGPDGATGEFSLLGADVVLQTPLALGPTRLTNMVMLRGQWSGDSLFPSQRFSLGGSSTVRGFRDDGISGRSGVLLREQIGFGIAELGASPHLKTSLSGFIAYDLGAIVPARDLFERGTLQSVSAGIKAQSRHLQGELAVSVPLSSPFFVQHETALVSATLRIML